MTMLESLRNISTVSANWLRSVGVRTPEDLAELGAVEVYRRAKIAFPDKVSLNLLYALEGALLDLPWNELPPAMKAKLKRQAE